MNVSNLIIRIPRQEPVSTTSRNSEVFLNYFADFFGGKILVRVSGYIMSDDYFDKNIEVTCHLHIMKGAKCRLSILDIRPISEDSTLTNEISLNGVVRELSDFTVNKTGGEHRRFKLEYTDKCGIVHRACITALHKGARICKTLNEGDTVEITAYLFVNSTGRYSLLFKSLI